MQGAAEAGDTGDGFDNLNDYYDVSLKEYRLRQLSAFDNFYFQKCDLSDEEALNRTFAEFQPEIVVNLAAQAGVRYSIDHPRAYINSNIVGFFNLLEACRQSMDSGQTPVRHLVFASSSSVYGMNPKVPYSVSDQTDWPVSLYAATKKAMSFWHMHTPNYMGFDDRTSLFYGLWAIRKAGYGLLQICQPNGKGEKIQIYNYGDMYRDFTYIDDIVKGILKVMDRVPSKDERDAMYRIYNIGNHKPENLMHFLDVLENSLLEAGVIRNRWRGSCFQCSRATCTRPLRM